VLGRADGIRRGLLRFLGIEHPCTQHDGPAAGPRLERELLAKRAQQPAEGVDSWGDAVALDTRDRRLRGVCALREFLLRDVVALADAAYELAGRGVSVVRHGTEFRRTAMVSFCPCDTSVMTRMAGMDDGVLTLDGRDLLQRYTRIAMVGLSANPSRPSYRVAVHLIAYGYDVTPVNPTVSEVLGIKAVPTLADAGPLEIVDVFRRQSEVPGVVDEAIALGAKAIWLQLGLSDDAAAARARAAGIAFVQDRCIKMEHCRWFGGLNWFGLATGVVSSRREETARAGR
jgi:predicted CoA-binding protein